MLGEETVLLKRARGQARPAGPAAAVPRRERGLFDQPTVVNNVQTLAAVPWIVRNGRDAFAAIGATDSPGTSSSQLRGPAGAGIAEVPLGTPLRDLVALAGGTGSRAVKAILVGGPTGGLLPADLLDTPYAFERAPRGGRPRRAPAPW